MFLKLFFICLKVQKWINGSHFRGVGRSEFPQNREKCNFVEKKLPKCLQVQKKSLPLHSLLRTRHNNNETTTKLKFQCKVSKGRLAQLVQSICLTSRGSAVRIRQRPRKYNLLFMKRRDFYLSFFVFFNTKLFHDCC